MSGVAQLADPTGLAEAIEDARGQGLDWLVIDTPLGRQSPHRQSARERAALPTEKTGNAMGVVYDFLETKGQKQPGTCSMGGVAHVLWKPQPTGPQMRT